MPTDVVSDNRIGCFFVLLRIGCSFSASAAHSAHRLLLFTKRRHNHLQYTQAKCVLYATYAFRMVRRHKDSKPWLSHGHRHHSRKRPYS